MKVLIANRGEIAVRVARAVRSTGSTVQFVHATGEQPLDPDSIALPGSGPAAYLDVEQVVRAALESGSEMLHPGYGFLSESSELARACAAAGIVFVGPSPDALGMFGNKSRARELAESTGVPVLASTGISPTAHDIAGLLADHPGGVMIKAVSGGGGRGMRAVTDATEIDDALQRCRSEAQRAFGDDSVYAERLMGRAKHIEIQVLADGSGAVAIGDRECSIQRQRQKVVEYAPSPSLTPTQRQTLWNDAVRLITPAGYRGLATVEFLVDADALARGELEHVFIEVNPRLQVEHTVTEELTSVDIVVAQLRLATGASLADLDLPAGVTDALALGTPTRFSVQCRVNAEELRGNVLVATTGTITALAWPESERVDTHLEVGSRVDGVFDSLLAKVITTTDGTVADAFAEAHRALLETRIDGVTTNRELLREILTDSTVTAGDATTTHLDELIASHTAEQQDQEPGVVHALMAGTIVHLAVKPGDPVGPRTVIATVEAMKMEHPVTAGQAGIVEAIGVRVGEQVAAGDLVAELTLVEGLHEADDEDLAEADLDLLRPDLAEITARRELTRDAARPEAVAKRHARGHLTTREQISALVDPDTFIEYGAFPVAAQRQRRDLQELIETTPADGIVTGLARINGDSAQDGGECVVLGYDYTVLAGTQGYFNHKKTDRVLDLAKRRELPVVFFTEGGGGRPGDVDAEQLMASGLTVQTFATMGSLSGRVPTIGVLTGRCFAGNAALLGCCDVIIATRDSNLGMAGPAMIEGGGLGSFTPEDIGPMDVQGPNGVVDLVVEDDHEAIAAARRYLSYFQGPREEWTQADQRLLRHAVGENRKQVYDIRHVIDTLADADSVFELRSGFGVGVVTALVRIAGRPMGLVANDPGHLGGAIDADGADKMARFLQLCDAHGLPVISLCDTPGFMVGPDSEQQATVRHFSRLFIIGAHLRVPLVTIVLRKAYGLGAQAMAGGGFLQPLATVAWPSGEMGGMGLEGAVRLGYAKELAAIEDPIAREQRFQTLVDAHYTHGKAINGAMMQELDDVIDPADTRRWIEANLLGHPSTGTSGRYVDAW